MIAEQQINAAKTLSVDEKLLFQDLLQDARNGTNGLDMEHKLQNVSETVFHLTLLNIMDKCKQPKNTWQSIVAECKWAIVSAIAIVSALLAFQPQLADLIKTFAR